MRTRTWLTALMFTCILLQGCSTLHRAAGTGDLAFRLAWEGISDLDLIVQDPKGNCIFFGNRQSPTGGVLDVDCNAGTDRLCAEPVENVFWQVGTAPDGEYLFWGHAHSLIGPETPLKFQMQVLRGTSVTWVDRRAAREHQELHGPFRIMLRNGRLAGKPKLAPGAQSQCITVEHGILAHHFNLNR